MSRAVLETAGVRNLSTDIVVAAALRLAAEQGVGAISLGRVARQLGCHVTSLYTHVDSIDDLRVRMALVVQGDLADRLERASAASACDGVGALRALAGVYREFGVAQPASIRLLFAMATTADPRYAQGAQQLAEPIRATLRGFGLDEEQVRHAHRAFSAAMRGFLMSETQDMYGADANDTFDEIVALFSVALQSGAWPSTTAGTTAGATAGATAAATTRRRH